jgi:hypothetical protein
LSAISVLSKPKTMASACRECGQPFAEACAHCHEQLCMVCSGTMQHGLPYCDGCEPEPDAVEEVPARRRIMTRTPLPDGSAAAVFYTDQVKVFQDRGAALKELGGNVRCISHCGRVRKVAGSSTFLKCRLATSDPPCRWVRLLAQSCGRIQPLGWSTVQILSQLGSED